MPTINATELKWRYNNANPDAPHFFDRKTMRFFGDTMTNFAVRDGGDVWTLIRKCRTVKGAPAGVVAHFDKLTSKRVFRREGEG